MDLFHTYRSILSAALFAVIVCGALTGPPDILAVEPTGQEVQAPSAPTTPPSSQIPREARDARYSSEAFILVLVVFGLLAVLFVLLLWWAGRLERTSYLGVLYRESVEEVEYRRLASRITEKFASGGYREDVEQDKEWMAANPRPSFPSAPPSPYPRSGTIGGTSPTRITGPNFHSEMSADDRLKVQEEYDRQKREYDEWDRRADDAARALYRQALADARKKALERANQAANVDLAVLRGRGAEFVLEFTTIVVLIFAATALGILGILETQQIGTLLAAIAGYVLGRASTRTRGTSGEHALTEEDRRTPVNTAELTELIRVVGGLARQPDQRPARGGGAGEATSTSGGNT
jgi:hypothetical protein